MDHLDEKLQTDVDEEYYASEFSPAIRRGFWAVLTRVGRPRLKFKSLLSRRRRFANESRKNYVHDRSPISARPTDEATSRLEPPSQSEEETPEGSGPIKLSGGKLAPPRKGDVLAQKKLARFPNKEIAPEVSRQFSDLVQLLNSRIVETLYQGPSAPGPVLFKLISLGEDESTAKPYVVIFCDKSVTSRVRHIVRENWYKEHCKDPEGRRPTLETVIDDREGRLKVCSADLAVLLSSSSSKRTYRGSILQVPGQREVFATIGGIITVKTGSAVQMFALTCGHFLQRSELRHVDKPGLVAVDSSHPDQVDETFEMNELEQTPTPDGNSPSSNKPNTVDTSEHVTSDAENRRRRRERALRRKENMQGTEDTEDMPDVDWRDDLIPDSFEQTGQESDFIKPGEIHLPLSVRGKVVASSYDADTVEPNHDWALVELAPQMENLAIVQELGHALTQLRDVEANSIQDLSTSAPFTSVVVLAGRSGIHHGVLSHETSFFMPPGGYHLIEVHSVHDLDVPLQVGDSGSWVIDSSGNTHGHFVAVGPFAEHLMVPIAATLRSIQNQLGADTVNIAREEDVRAWLDRTPELCRRKSANGRLEDVYKFDLAEAYSVAPDTPGGPTHTSPKKTQIRGWPLKFHLPISNSSESVPLPKRFDDIPLAGATTDQTVSSDGVSLENRAAHSEQAALRNDVKSHGKAPSVTEVLSDEDDLPENWPRLESQAINERRASNDDVNLSNELAGIPSNTGITSDDVVIPARMSMETTASNDFSRVPSGNPELFHLEQKSIAESEASSTNRLFVIRPRKAFKYHWTRLKGRMPKFFKHGIFPSASQRKVFRSTRKQRTVSEAEEKNLDMMSQQPYQIPYFELPGSGVPVELPPVIEIPPPASDMSDSSR
ncbi:hypothetical protein NA57DRAFT_76365 [Rhizodiscina lignyota]|uniref:Uncharacterized protein n=1 Tax=Rhizodiscina lignyota TaxID=1504668 RepID=A0A9P4M993_9PEZI|nr:hypothetical protein NA57DRAFT_76365 [Rhizodiscina lignyota]